MLLESCTERSVRLFCIFCRARPGNWPLKQKEASMAKDFARSFYKSKAWLKCRDAYIRQRIGIDGGMCEECKDNLGYIVHHKEPLTELTINDPEITLNTDNLEYVCKKCHDEFEGHGFKHNHKLKPLVEFDATGMPVRMRART